MARTGQKLKLECQFTGLPTPTISWTHNGKLIKENRDLKVFYLYYFTYILIIIQKKIGYTFYTNVIFKFLFGKNEPAHLLNCKLFLTVK